MKKVFALMEVSPDGAHTFSIYDTRKAALKSALMLMLKSVTDALEFYRLTGESSAEYCYRNPVRFGSKINYLWVEEEKVLTEKDFGTVQYKDN